MAKVTIGGEAYTVPELNFIALEWAWPHIELFMTTEHPMHGTSAGLHVIAAGLVEAPSFQGSLFGLDNAEHITEEERYEWVYQFLRRKLKGSEIPGITLALNAINEEAGLVAASGEAKTPEKENPSTEIAPDTSSNSSLQELKEVAGIA